MLAVQLAIIAVLLTSGLLLAYSSTARETSETKAVFLKAMNSQFNKRSFETLINQVLESPGETCLDKKHAAANALKTLSKILETKGVEVKVGFTNDLKTCDCHEPEETVSINEVESSAAEAILSCVDNKLAIANTIEGGFAVVRFEMKMKNAAESITLNYGDAK